MIQLPPYTFMAPTSAEAIRASHDNALARVQERMTPDPRLVGVLDKVFRVAVAGVAEGDQTSREIGHISVRPVEPDVAPRIAESRLIPPRNERNGTGA